MAVPSFAAAAGPAVVEHRMTFSVANVNRSLVPCATDGSVQDVEATLVRPAVGVGGSVTVYLHGVGLGEFYWRFDAVSGYDFARAMAERGHASVVLDRVGYGVNGMADGLASCVGGQADIAHQIVESLRNGAYETTGAPATAFGAIALAGHSAGGFIAEIAAYSFANIDALVVMSHSDNIDGPSDLFRDTLAEATRGCVGTVSDPHSDHYAFFGTPEQFELGQIHDMEHAVVDELMQLRRRDPCGDVLSALPGFTANQAGIRTIGVPVLVLVGEQDAFFPGQAEAHAASFTGANDVTGVSVAGAGHLLALERGRNATTAHLSAWLGDRGF